MRRATAASAAVMMNASLLAVGGGEAALIETFVGSSLTPSGCVANAPSIVTMYAGFETLPGRRGRRTSRSRKLEVVPDVPHARDRLRRVALRVDLERRDVDRDSAPAADTRLLGRCEGIGRAVEPALIDAAADASRREQLDVDVASRSARRASRRSSVFAAAVVVAVAPASGSFIIGGQRRGRCHVVIRAVAVIAVTVYGCVAE